MTGQEAATLVKAFNDVASITGAPTLKSPTPYRYLRPFALHPR